MEESGNKVKMRALRQTVGSYGNVDPGQTFYTSEEVARELEKGLSPSAKRETDGGDTDVKPPTLPDESKSVLGAKAVRGYSNKAAAPGDNKEEQGGLSERPL